MASIVNKYHLITTDRLDEIKQGLRNLPVKEGTVPEDKSGENDIAVDNNESPMDEDINDDDEVDEVESAYTDKSKEVGGQAGEQLDIASVPSCCTVGDGRTVVAASNASIGGGDDDRDSEGNDSGNESSFDDMNKFNAGMMQARMTMQRSRVNRDMSIKSRRAKVEQDWISFS